MRVPRSLLPHRIQLEPYAGAGASGPSFATAVPRVRARVQAVRRVVRTAAGSDVTSTATATVRPADAVVAESLVTIDRDVSAVLSGTYTVIGLDVGEGLRGPAYVDLLLDGPH